jgi:succinate dehydrogenase / fumarate reductase cytochrome b subunit
MSWVVSFYRSAVGKKIVMALTGIILFGFVVGHFLGNLKLYFGAETLNEYGVWLRTLGHPAFPNELLLWVARIILLVALILHIDAATRLTLMNRRARRENYAERDAVVAGYAARTMRWGGVIVLIFIIYHLLDFTFGTVNPGFEHGNIYRNVVASFSNVWVSAFYILGNVALGFHLYHGLWSMFQSLGLNNPKFNAWRRHFATAFAVLITAGNLSFPIAVLAGIVKCANSRPGSRPGLCRKSGIEPNSS